jgi:putative NADH-flavin reductase
MNSKDQNGKALGRPAPRLAQTPPQALRVLVIGGSHGIGLETVKLALDRGHTVTVMARRPERLALTHPRLVTIEGDILDADTVREAIADQDAIVMAIGMGLTRKPVTMFSRGTENVLDAMEAAKTRRLVAVTGMGAGDTREHGGFFYDRIFRPLALRTVYEDKDRQEALIEDRGKSFPLVWTIVRPGVLGGGAPKHRYRVVTDLTGVSGGQIARSDVAHFIVAALESESHVGETPLLIN